MDQQQIREQHCKHCTCEVVEACIEAGGMLMDVAQSKAVTPHASLETLADIRRQLDRAEAALRLLADEQQRLLRAVK